jgi:hypothetical protein
MPLVPFLIYLDMSISGQVHVERSSGSIFKDCKRTIAGVQAKMERWEFGRGTFPTLFCKPTTVSLQEIENDLL